MYGIRRTALTLVELLIVLVILVALAGILLPLLTGATQDAQATATRSSLQDLAKLIVRYRTDSGLLPGPGFVGVNAKGRASAPQLRYLFVNPGSSSASDPLAESTTPSYSPFTKIGWNGPYLSAGVGLYAVNAASGFTTSFGLDGDPAVMDGWYHPVVLVPFTDALGNAHAWLQSAGPNGLLEIPSATGLPSPPAAPAQGSVFPTATGPVTVDDLTFVVF